jgi:DNA polymerase III epsilon subunit-like protein
MPHYILFDTETTGNQPQDRIIQVGAIIVRSKTDIEVIDELCSTDIPISLEAMEVHGITPDVLTDKPPYSATHFAQRIEELNSPQNYLIAHNIDFDRGMLEKEGFTSQYKQIDTVRCARHLLPDLPYHRLQYLRYALELYRDEQAEAKKLGITIKAHDAIGDVLILKLLFSRLVEEVRQQFPDDNPIDKMVELTQEPVMIKTFKFGKYKGESIEEIATKDPGYLAWMRKNLDLDEDMRHTLDAYIQ